MNSIVIGINNVLWTITAVLCWFYEHPILESIVFITTAICVIDLGIKFRKMNYAIAPFIKAYWLDILFLLPICKMFRACRVIKAGRALKAIDISCDITEMSTNLYSALKHRDGLPRRNHGKPSRRRLRIT